MINTYPIQLNLIALLSLALWLVSPLVQADSEAIERIAWKKAPIPLTLVIGQEQRIEFPGTVKVGVPATVQGLLRIQSVNGAVYLLAQAPFGTTRLMVREIDSGQIYLFDVLATENAAAGHPLQIYVANPIASDSDDSTAGNAARPGSLGYIQLTRFAAQQLYAPARLVSDQPGIVRVPVARDPVRLMHGGAIEAVPLVAWRTNGLYVTAIKLTNLTEQAQVLDPRQLRGEWLTATFQHHRLLRKGDEADTTAVYLISARPFAVKQ